MPSQPFLPSRQVFFRPPTGASGPPGPGSLPSAELGAHSIAAILQRRRRIILLSLVFVLGAVAGLTPLLPKTYKSSATLLLDKQGPRDNSPALAVLERLGRGSQIETEMNLLQSRSVIAPVVDQLDLHVVVLADGNELRPNAVFPEFDAGPDALPGDYRILPGPHGHYQIVDAQADAPIAQLSSDSAVRFAGLTVRLPARVPYKDVTIRTALFPAVVEKLQKRVDVSLVHREADLIKLVCKGPTPAAAQQLCEGVAANYLRLRTELQGAEASATAAFLREQVARVGAQLSTAEDSVEAYARQHEVAALEQQASQETQQFAQVQAQRDQLEAERAALAGLMSGIEQSDSRRYEDLVGFPTLLKNQAVTSLLVSLMDMQNRRSDLALRRTERNADLAALDARIGEIKQQLQAIATSYRQGLVLQIKSLDLTLRQMGQRLAAIPGEQVRSARLQRQASVLEDVYRLLETRRREAEVAEAVKLPNIHVVDAASLPFAPSWPKLPVNLVLGVFLGLASGIGLAAVREYADTRLHERREVERETGLPVLTMIPKLRLPGPVVPLSFSHTSGEAREQERSGSPRSAMGRSPKRSHHTSRRAQRETQVALEAFGALAVDLNFAGRRLNGGDLQSVAVTSAGRGEGKTMAACNLALVRARHGVRTLLIDADMRASGVSAFFRLAAQRYGLSDLLAGSVDLGAVAVNLWVGGGMLAVIPAGTPTPHSAGLLDSPSFGRLLEQVRSQFDLIVIDTPPLNLITDAATIAATVGAVVLVVRGGVTDREALEMALDRLGRTNASILGVVLNDVRLPSGYASSYDYVQPPSGQAR